jgi:hypothetical protein
MDCSLCVAPESAVRNIVKLFKIELSIESLTERTKTTRGVEPPQALGTLSC